MKALKSGKVSGEKDEKGKWIFDPAEIVRWRGEPGGDKNGDIQVYSKPDTSSENPLQTETIEILRAQVQQLDGHLKTKDDQIEKLQDTLRDHTKLLEKNVWLKTLSCLIFPSFSAKHPWFNKFIDCLRV